MAENGEEENLVLDFEFQMFRLKYKKNLEECMMIELADSVSG